MTGSLVTFVTRIRNASTDTSNLNNYPYLWATAVNPNSNTANQPAILITQLTADPVPEPSTLSVLGIGLLIFGVAWRRRQAA
jgi:hypothetical protein